MHESSLYQFLFVGNASQKKRNKYISTSLDDFLKEEGVLEETLAIGLKETLAWQVQHAMEKDKSARHK